MPIIKSAKKRVKITQSKTQANRIHKSRLKTAIKKFERLVSEDNTENIPAELSKTQKLIDKTAAKGIIHKNNAARKKAQLAKLANSALNVSNQ